MVAPKNFETKHPELEIPNLEVVKACQSLTSKGYVKTQFSWQWYFYTLTEEVRLRFVARVACADLRAQGLNYLREYLHLPAEIVPATHKRPARPQREAPTTGAYRPPRRDGPGGFGGEGRDEYRRRDGPGADKKDGAPSGEYRPRFAGAGVGRGAPRE